MGAIKFRQGRSVRIGLPQNAPKRIVRSKRSKSTSTESIPKLSWLMATIKAITNPFVKAVSNYRGRGNK